MEIYDEHLTIQAATRQLFDRFNFPADAYTAKWFVIPIGKFYDYDYDALLRMKVRELRAEIGLDH